MPAIRRLDRRRGSRLRDARYRQPPGVPDPARHILRRAGHPVGRVVLLPRLAAMACRSRQGG